MDERNPSRQGKEAGRAESPKDAGSAAWSEESEGAGGRSPETVGQPARGAARQEGSPPRGARGGQGGGGGSDVREKGKEAAGAAMESGREAMEEVREKAGQVGHEMKERMGEAAQERKSEAAEALQRVARAIRSASDSLREEDAENIGRYGDRAADQIERLSGYVRENDLESMVSNVENFARRRPEIFFGGLLLSGVIAGRFLRSSSPRGGRSEISTGYSSRRGAELTGAGRGALPRPRAGDGITERGGTR